MSVDPADMRRRTRSAALTDPDVLDAELARRRGELASAVESARYDWQARGGQWDPENNAPQAMASENNTAWTWSTGRDWTAEEKKELLDVKVNLRNAVLKVIGFATTVTAYTTTQIDNSGRPAAANGTATAALALGSGVTAFSIVDLGLAIRDWYHVLARHDEAMKHPGSVVMAEADGLSDVIDNLERRLAAIRGELRAVLPEEAARIEEV